MSDDPVLSLEKAAGENEIAFDYIKSPDFRVAWVDGAVGGVTPQGLIHCAVYAERMALPRRQVFKTTPLNEHLSKLGDEVLEKQISRGAVVREMAMDLMMTADGAETLGRWLLSRAAELRDAKDQVSSGRGE